MRAQALSKSALMAALLVSLLTPWAWGKPVLVAESLVLDIAPERVSVAQWQGRPAIVVLSGPAKGADGGKLPRRMLSIVRLENDSLTLSAVWEVPAELRWAEPLPLPSGRWAWLGLIGATWQLGIPRGRRLVWQTVCPCKTAFAVGRSALRLQTPLMADLNGDGILEVLLPHWNGLVVYRLTMDHKLVPLWRDGWTIIEKFTEKDGRIEARFKFPRFHLLDANGDGVRDLVQIDKQELRITLHPPAATPPRGEFFAFDAETRARLSGKGLPEQILVALQEMGDTSFASRMAIVEALRQIDGVHPFYLDTILAAAREEIPVYFPRSAPLHLPQEEPGQSRRIIAVHDMNGDGVIDVLLVDSTEKGDPFNQKNQIRWYPGTFERGRQRFKTQPTVFFTEGVAFARMTLPAKPDADQPSLFIATMDVNLMALVRAFVTRKVSFEVYLRPWENGALIDPAPISGSLDFRIDFGQKKGRPLLLAADLDGDGRREFLFNLQPNSLTAFNANPGDEDFGDSPLARIAVPLPRKPEDILVAELGDGRESLLLHYRGNSYSSEERRTLRIVRLVDGPDEGDGGE